MARIEERPQTFTRYRYIEIWGREEWLSLEHWNFARGLSAPSLPAWEGAGYIHGFRGVIRMRFVGLLCQMCVWGERK